MDSKPIVISDQELNESDSKSLYQKSTEMQGMFPKAVEEKQTITYKRLVVPNSMRSIYWQYFGFPATDQGEILTKVKIICTLCKTQIAYNRNTSNLRMHLQNKHGNILSDLEATSPPKKPVISQESKERRAQKRLLKATLKGNQHIYTTNSDGTIQLNGDIQLVTDSVNLDPVDDLSLNQPVRVMIKGENQTFNQSNQNLAYLMSDFSESSQTCIEGKTVSEVITDGLIMDLQLPAIVDDEGFHRIVAALKSPCEIPSKSKLEKEILPTVYQNFRYAVGEIVKSIPGEMSLSVEEWQSIYDESFITFSIFYQKSGEPDLEFRVLKTLHAPADWQDKQWTNAVESLFQEWHLDVEKFTAAIVATTNETLLVALASQGLVLIPCLLHTFQLCAQTCFQKKQIDLVLRKCRAIINAIASSPIATEAMALQEQTMQLEENGLVTDYRPVWISTYNMLEQMILRKEILGSKLESVNGIDREFMDLTQEQWEIIEDLVAVLEPFKVTIMTLSEERMPLISLLKPLLWRLVSCHLKFKDSDSAIARDLKQSLSQMLSEQYSDPNVKLVLQISTTLDPRFKKILDSMDEDTDMIEVSIKEMLTKLIIQNRGDVDKKKTEEEPSVKKSRLSGMEMLLGGFCAKEIKMPADEKADLELVQYQSENTAELNSCPLQWWSRVSIKCPNLGKLAQRYNCVPACCTPPFRLAAPVQILYSTKRSTLPTHLVDKLLFLNGNFSTTL